VELAEEVDGYLRRTGMSATRFGRLVARDPSLVSDMRRGRRPFGALRARILAQLGRPESLAQVFAAALTNHAGRAGYVLADKVEVFPWASSGLVGEQAICRLRPTADASRSWAEGLPDHEWSLPLLVADLDVAWTEHGVRVTALLLPGN